MTVNLTCLMIAMEQETWQGDTLRFRILALGQNSSASIEVPEGALRIEVSLPTIPATDFIDVARPELWQYHTRQVLGGASRFGELLENLEEEHI